MPFNPTFRAFGNSAVLIEWPAKISENVLSDVLNTKNQLDNLIDKEILYINHTYNSILVNYGYSIENINIEISYIKSIISEPISQPETKNQHWKIPVCYDEKFGLDLVEISEQKKLPKSEIIRLHSEAIYTVYFIGFLPGFLYLGGLNIRLHINRKSTPRLQLKKGAVGIGGQQTGIYPKQSPGGWHIIGNSPLNFFDLKNEQPCFANAGDKVSFRAISINEHEEIENKVERGEFDLKSMLIND